MNHFYDAIFSKAYASILGALQTQYNPTSSTKQSWLSRCVDYNNKAT